MANSGFNQGQTGNASEVGAGVVKLATQAQIDAKQADDGGVPLVVTPDKTPAINPALLYVGEATDISLNVGTGTAVEYFNYMITGGIIADRMFVYEGYPTQMKATSGGTTLYFTVWVNDVQIGSMDVSGSSDNNTFYPQIRALFKRTGVDSQQIDFLVTPGRDYTPRNLKFTTAIVDGVDYEISLRFRSASAGRLEIPFQTLKLYTL